MEDVISSFRLTDFCWTRCVTYRKRSLRDEKMKKRKSGQTGVRLFANVCTIVRQETGAGVLDTLILI